MKRCYWFGHKWGLSRFVSGKGMEFHCERCDEWHDAGEYIHGHGLLDRRVTVLIFVLIATLSAWIGVARIAFGGPLHGFRMPADGPVATVRTVEEFVGPTERNTLALWAEATRNRRDIVPACCDATGCYCWIVGSLRDFAALQCGCE